MEKFQLIKYLVILFLVCFLKTGFTQKIDFKSCAAELGKLGIQIDQPTEGNGSFLKRRKDWNIIMICSGLNSYFEAKFDFMRSAFSNENL